jgi:transposase-like protein
METKLKTQQACLAYLEKMRWGKTVKCPYCLSEKVHPAKSEEGRHFCYNCVKSFSVMVNTIFEDTRLGLPIWFEIINAMLKNKSGLSANIIASQFGITLKTAWLTSMKIRCAMVDAETGLNSAFQTDKNYSGKSIKGTVKKISGKAKTQSIEKTTSMVLLRRLKRYIKADQTSMTSSKAGRSYIQMDEAIENITATHLLHKGKQTDINSIEVFWDYIKNAIKTNHKALSEKYLPFYLAEFEYKFNRRKKRHALFSELIKNAVSNPSPIVNTKAIKSKKEVAYALAS